MNMKNCSNFLAIDNIKNVLNIISEKELSTEEKVFRSLCFLSEYGTKETIEASNYILLCNSFPKFPKTYF